MRNIILVDSFSTYSLHQMFNACFACILNNVKYNVQYYVGKKQRAAISAIIQENNINLVPGFAFRTIYVPDRSGRLSLLFRYLTSTAQNLRFLICSGVNDLIVFNINNPFSLGLLKLINFLLKRKILIITHGELEFIQNRRNKLKVPLFYFFLSWILYMGFLLSKKSKNIYYLVLGDIIKQNFVNYNIVPESQILSIDHPYFFNIQQYDQGDSSHIKIGTIGTFSGPKGSSNFLKIASYFKNESKISFHVVGSLFDNKIDLAKFPNVTFHSTSREFISREKYNNLIKNLDYVLLLYPSSMYALMASGAIYDAISYNKPVICFRCDYFAYLFSKHGALGIMCENFEEMLKKISLLGRQDNHFVFDRNIEKAKQFHSIENISKQFSKILIENQLI